jgi:type I restriction enzyme, S subunit
VSWSMVPIGDVSEILSGNAWKSSQFTTEVNERLPIIRIQNVSDKPTDFVYWDGEIIEKYIINNGDILLSLSGNVKLCEWKFGKALLNQRVVRLEPVVNMDQRYFYWAIHNVVDKLEAMAKHAVIANVSVTDLKEYSIPLPPLPEQKRIAAILDKADDIRRKRQQAIQLADEFLRAVFLDMFGDPVTNPKNWDEYVLKDIAEIRSGVTKGKKVEPSTAVTLPYMRVANVQDGYLDLSDIQHITVSSTDAEKCRLINGDILLTEGGDPDKLGRGYVWHGEIKSCIHQNHIFSVRIHDQNTIDPLFLSAVIGSQRGKRYFLKVGKQTTGIATINKTVLSEFMPFLPPYKLQLKYVEVLKKIQAVKRQYELVNVGLFESLSLRAFSGKL